MIVPIVRSSPGSMAIIAWRMPRACMWARRCGEPKGGVSETTGFSASTSPASSSAIARSVGSIVDAVVAGAVGRAQRVAVAGEQQDLGDVGVEGLERAGEQRLERLGDLGRAAERAVGVVEELQPLVALALGDVGAVDGEDGQRRDEQHRDGARVGGDDERGGDRDATR